MRSATYPPVSFADVSRTPPGDVSLHEGARSSIGRPFFVDFSLHVSFLTT
jgi:hypothetical protein